MGSFFKFGGRFIAHGQGIGQRDGVEEGRQGYASTSTDFFAWDKQYLDAFRVPEPDDVSKRGLVGDYPQVHLGVGASSFGNVAVGLWGIWHNPPPKPTAARPAGTAPDSSPAISASLSATTASSSANPSPARYTFRAKIPR